MLQTVLEQLAVGLSQSGPGGYKIFFMLNSAEDEISLANKSQIKQTIPNTFLLNIAEHENFSANKYENAYYYWHFHIY